MSEEISIVLVELNAGTISVALRFGQSHTVQILEGWENLPPGEAAKIAVDIACKKIAPEEVASRVGREATIPDGHIWEKM
jgi:hypothetical protein